jgi:hypothetical protein
VTATGKFSRRAYTRGPLKPHSGSRKGLLDRLLNPIEDADGHDGDNPRSDAGQQKGFHDSSPQRIEMGEFAKILRAEMHNLVPSVLLRK